MRRKASGTVPEGNDPVPQKEELGSGQPTMEDVYRIMKEAFDRWDKKLNEISDKMGEQTEVLEKRLTRLEHGARQPRLAMEADGQADTKTRERTEGAATAVYKQCVEMAFLHAGLNPAQTPTRPVSARRPNLPFSLAGMMSWSRAALPHPSRVSQLWRCAH